MLVLSRKVGEKLNIGSDIVLEILRIDHNGNIRIGIEAPRDVSVDRSEIYLKKANTNGSK
jgi:carbon storage regulator